MGFISQDGASDGLFFFSSRRRHTRLQGDWSSDVFFFFSSRRRHTRLQGDWSSDVWLFRSVFASDALSSTAYATEEILLVLILAGTAALSYSLPIGIAIAALIAIVVSSYRQTILAYPQGGGAYIVSKDNLGTYPALVAGAALLIDYVLTVAVSVAAGIAAVTSAAPWPVQYRLVLCVAA